MIEPLFLFGRILLVGLATYIVVISYRSYKQHNDPVLGMIFYGFTFIALALLGDVLFQHVVTLPPVYSNGTEIILNVIGFSWIISAVRG